MEEPEGNAASTVRPYRYFQVIFNNVAAEIDRACLYAVHI